MAHEARQTSLRWDVHGTLVELSSELPLPASLGYPLRRFATDRREGEVALRLFVKSGPLPEKERFAGQRVHLHRREAVIGAYAEPRYWLGWSNGGVVGDLLSGTACFYAPTVGWLKDLVVLRTLLPIAMQLHLARRGLIPIHAAVVVDPMEQGWVLIGGGGVGKSSLCYALVRRGWCYVGDDSALLRAGHGGLQVLCFADEFLLPRQLEARLGPVLWDPAVREHPHKGVVAMDRGFPGCFLARTHPAYLIGLRLAKDPHAGGAIRRGTDLLKIMVEDNPFLLANQPEQHLALLTRLVGECRRGSLAVHPGVLDDPESALHRAVEDNHAALPADTPV